MKTTPAEEDLEVQSFGLALMLLRRARGLTLMALAASCGSTRGNLSGYETGRMRPHQKTLRRILHALDVSPGIFYRAQQLVIEAATGHASGDMHVPAVEMAELPRTHDAALRLAREVGRAVAQATLAFLELRAGGWEDRAEPPEG